MENIFDQTEEEITEEILSYMPDKYQKTVGFPLWDFFKALSYEIKKIYSSLKEIISWQDIDNMKGEDLHKWCEQRRNIKWKNAVASKGVLKGTGNFKIDKGTIVGESETGLQYSASETCTSENNIGYIKIECTTKGIIGNVPAGAIKKIPVNISGLTSIINEQACSGGYDAETDDELKARYYEDLRRPVTSGNIYHYEKWAKECIGVGNAKIKPLWNGDNTVKIIIINQNMEPAEEELITKVQNYIDPGCKGIGEGMAPIGAYCTVASAEPKLIDISVKIEVKNGIDNISAQQSVENALKSYIKTIAFKKDFVSYAQIGAIIINTAEIKDYKDLFINGQKDNILIANDATSCEVAILGNIDINVFEGNVI